MKPRTKPYWEMNLEELRAATKEFDAECVEPPGVPLTPAQEARHRRAAGWRGRPRRGQGVQVISVSVEKSLLRRADRRAKSAGISRAQLIACGLEAVLSSP